MDIRKTISTDSASPKSLHQKRRLSGRTGMSAPKRYPSRVSSAEPQHLPGHGEGLSGLAISDVHYHYMHDMLSHDAMVLGIAYRMAGKETYAQNAAEILRLYADKYKDYGIVDNYGKQSSWGARVYSQTQLYGMALHKEWDQMSVDHNTITADELRQDQATGKLIAWEEGDDYVAVTASAGPAYQFAELARSILVTEEYALQIDRAHSTDGKPHVFDFNYHNYGKQTGQLQMTPYGEFPKVNGYLHLEQAQRGETSGDVPSRFDNEGTVMSLEVLGGTPTEVFQGVAPGPHPAVKVPFVIVRRKGVDVEFITLLIPSKGEPPKVTARIGEGGTIVLHGPGWVDSVTLDEVIRYDRANGSSSTP
jgi:hypothetical protein